MIVHVPLAIFLLVNAVPTDAALFSRSSDSLVSMARHARHHVTKRSTGLWDDIRLAYTGMLQQNPQILQSKPYCKNNADTGLSGTGLKGTGTGEADGTNGTSAAARGSSPRTSSGSSSSATSATSVAPTTSSSASVSVAGTGTASSSAATSISSQPSSPWMVAQSYVSTSGSRFSSFRR